MRRRWWLGRLGDGIGVGRTGLVEGGTAAICLLQRFHRPSSIATAQPHSLEYTRLPQPVGRFHESRAIFRLRGPPGRSPQTQACRSGEMLGTGHLLSSASHQATFCGRSGSECRQPQTVSLQFGGRSCSEYERLVQRPQLAERGRSSAKWCGGKRMHISQNGGTFTAQHVTGPTHNLLRLKIARGAPQPFVVSVLPPVGECDHAGGLSLEEIALAIEAGLADANAALNADYIVEAAAIVEDDTRQRGIYECLTRKIVERAAATREA